MRIIRYLSRYISRDVLDQIYKFYVRPHLYYGDIICHKYDPEFKLDFTKKLKSVQYSAVPVVTGAGRETSTDSLCEEVGWEILCCRKWYIEACVTFTNCGMIRDRMTYIQKYDKNVSF